MKRNIARGAVENAKGDNWKQFRKHLNKDNILEIR